MRRKYEICGNIGRFLPFCIVFYLKISNFLDKVLQKLIKTVVKVAKILTAISRIDSNIRQQNLIFCGENAY